MYVVETASWFTSLFNHNTADVVTIPTKHACLGQAGSSVGWYFIIGFSTIVILYITLGCVWSHARTEKRGLEALPNIGFWRELPSLVADGCKYSMGMATCFMCKVTGKVPEDDL